MKPPSQTIKPILLYLLFAIIYSSVFYSLIIYNGKLNAGFGMYVTGLMWCPGLAAITTTLLLKRRLSVLGWQWKKAKYLWRSYWIPLLYAAIAYCIIWFAGWGSFYNHEFVDSVGKSFGWTGLPAGAVIFFYSIVTGVFGMAGSMATALGEEIGWRGFLVPELYNRIGYTKTALLSGLIWSLWHYPILLFADYNSGTPAWYGLSCFTTMVIAISFVFAWLRIRSGTLWTGVLLHASHNLFIQNIFTPLTGDTGKTKYYIDEFGIVLPVICIFFAIWFWTKRKELAALEI
ncbi:MAG: type II CAAX endopeptidase family protein [Chitinophagaceae bacterium]